MMIVPPYPRLAGNNNNNNDNKRTHKLMAVTIAALHLNLLSSKSKLVCYHHRCHSSCRIAYFNSYFTG
jgi:hypothetical protein